MITVLPHKFVTAWPDAGKSRRASLAHVCPIAEAMSAEYATDAHFQAAVSSIPHRLDTGAIGQCGIQVHVLVADVDGAGHRADDAWWETERAKIAQLLAAHPDGFVYRTRGGYRIVYALPEPIDIRTPADAEAYRLFYDRWILYLARAFGIVADPACSDWTRVFRLPHATRGVEPERLETIGNPARLGVWRHESDMADDIATARRLGWGAVLYRLDPRQQLAVQTVVRPRRPVAEVGVLCVRIEVHP